MDFCPFPNLKAFNNFGLGNKKIKILKKNTKVNILQRKNKNNKRSTSP